MQKGWDKYSHVQANTSIAATLHHTKTEATCSGTFSFFAFFFTSSREFLPFLMSLVKGLLIIGKEIDISEGLETNIAKTRVFLIFQGFKKQIQFLPTGDTQS